MTAHLSAPGRDPASDTTLPRFLGALTSSTSPPSVGNPSATRVGDDRAGRVVFQHHNLRLIPRQGGLMRLSSVLHSTIGPALARQSASIGAAPGARLPPVVPVAAVSVHSKGWVDDNA